MPEVTTVTQVVQLGVESTLGTSVAANKKLPSLQFAVGLDGSFTEVVGSGNKFPSLEVLGKESSKASISGQPTYDELTYLLASLFNKPTPVQQSATTAYKWTFSPSSSAEDTIASYTVEQGSGVRAHKFTGGIVSELKLSGDREKVDVSGTMLGQVFADGITLTASPTAVPLVPIFAKEVDVYMDAASAGLGTTKLGRLFSWELNIANVRAPLWVVDSSQSSWAVPVEQVVDGSLSINVEADSVGMGLLSTMRASGTKFLRLKSTSPTNAGTAIPHSLTIDLAGQISEVPSEFSDNQGVVAIGWKFKLVHDATWGKAITADLINTRTAL